MATVADVFESGLNAEDVESFYLFAMNYARSYSHHSHRAGHDIELLDAVLGLKEIFSVMGSFSNTSGDTEDWTASTWGNLLFAVGYLRKRMEIDNFNVLVRAYGDPTPITIYAPTNYTPSIPFVKWLKQQSSLPSYLMEDLVKDIKKDIRLSKKFNKEMDFIKKSDLYSWTLHLSARLACSEAIEQLIIAFLYYFCAPGDEYFTQEVIAILGLRKRYYTVKELLSLPDRDPSHIY